MRVEDCLVTVERRSAGGCIDLAFVFTRQFFVPIYRLMLLFAVPNCIIAWWLTSMATDMLIPNLILFSIFSAFFGGALVAAIGPQVFGVPISIRAAVRGLRQHIFTYGLMMGVARVFQLLTSFCVILPSILVTSWCGHIAEVVVLEKTPLPNVTSRLSWLAAGGGYGRNLSRVATLLVFWALLSGGLLVLIDVLALMLFNVPIFLGQLSVATPDTDRLLASVLLDDPKVQLTICVALWLPYPIIRVAWFFCYLDQRIRNECWDLDLQFRVEAIRLEEAGL